MDTSFNAEANLFDRTRAGSPLAALSRPRLAATVAARALLARLQHRHGPLMLHQAVAPRRDEPPLCFAHGDFPLAEQDVLLGEIDGTPFFRSRDCHRRHGQASVWLDAVPGRAGLFSLERATGLKFFASPHPPVARGYGDRCGA